MMNRIAIDGTEHPHFIGCWQLEDAGICDGLIEFFEARQKSQRPGIAGDGSVTETIKKSMDMTITPRELEQDGYGPVNAYMETLSACFMDYLEQWPFLKSVMPHVHVGSFNIQRYDAGGHYMGTHSERISLESLHRVLVWMTYLNDVPEGGETSFDLYGLKVKPERGKTLIWPAEWTHAHSGGLVPSGQKYIITGWMHFPDNPVVEDKD